jgi:LuxR family maltose regulon positive regulatory protein
VEALERVSRGRVGYLRVELHRELCRRIAIAMRGRTGPGAALVRAVSAAPDLDGWAMADRLLTDLAPLDRAWLVVDDVHELGPEVLRQLELLVMRPTAGCIG